MCAAIQPGLLSSDADAVPPRALQTVWCPSRSSSLVTAFDMHLHPEYRSVPVAYRSGRGIGRLGEGAGLRCGSRSRSRRQNKTLEARAAHVSRRSRFDDRLGSTCRAPTEAKPRSATLLPVHGLGTDGGCARIISKLLSAVASTITPDC